MRVVVKLSCSDVHYDVFHCIVVKFSCSDVHYIVLLAWIYSMHVVKLHMHVLKVFVHVFTVGVHYIVLQNRKV